MLFAVALEYLLRTSSAGGGPSRYPWTAEQYLRITPSYESKGKKAGGWRIVAGKEASTGDKGAEKEDRERGQSDGNRDGDEWRIASRRGRKTKLIRETKCVLWK